MKKLLIILFFLSCSKSNIITQQWQIQKQQDTTLFENSPYFCSGSKTYDTLTMTFTAKPDTVQMKNFPVIESVEDYGDRVIRRYFIYLKQVK